MLRLCKLNATLNDTPIIQIDDLQKCQHSAWVLMNVHDKMHFVTAASDSLFCDAIGMQ